MASMDPDAMRFRLRTFVGSLVAAVDELTADDSPASPNHLDELLTVLKAADSGAWSIVHDARGPEL